MPALRLAPRDPSAAATHRRAALKDRQRALLGVPGPRAEAELLATLEPLIQRMARHYWSSLETLDSDDFADLLAEGRLGGLLAIRRFDRSKGVQLATYAAYWIRVRIQGAAARSASPVSVNPGLHRGGRQRECLLRNADPATIEGASVQASATHAPAVRLDAPMRNGMPWADVLGGEGFEEQAAIALDIERMLAVVAELDDRDRTVIILRAYDWTLREIGEVVGLSRERVRQLEERAMGRVRRGMGIQ